ncbi:MAG: DUF5110 domain-containing protein [Phycisphaerales bacterium]|nr:DUF5110 domain-containing protein [Phycisphaerales bacterium]
MRQLAFLGKTLRRIAAWLAVGGAAAAADELSLRPADAVLRGADVVFDWHIPRQCLAGWSRTDSAATWEFETRAATTLEVLVEQSCPEKNVGGEFAIEIGAQRLTGKVTPTKDADTFALVELGEIRIPAPGRQELVFRPTKLGATGGLCGLRRIVVRGKGVAPALPRYTPYSPAAAAQRITERTLRFAPSGVEFAQPPYFAKVIRGEAARIAEARVQPAFGTSNHNPARWFRSAPPPLRYSAHLAIEPGTSLYATGEAAGPLLRNGKVTMCWNTDAWAYNLHSMSLYQSHPWVLAVRADGSAYGVLADTTYRCEIDLRDGIRFTADGPAFPVFVIEAATPLDVVQELSELTGRMSLPPLWALGYQQCRWSYFPENRVREIAAGFRQRKIPCDVLWLDIDYMDGFRVFTFDRESFPDPARLNADLRGMGFHTVWMIDPGVKVDENYAVFRSGTAGDHWVKTADDEPFHGNVWPGPCVFPDFTRPETRVWWANLYGDFLSQGIDGVWNDMNEPAVFDVLTKTMPEDNVHRGGGELPPGSHAQYHNLYGMLMVRATREGIVKARPEKRPFVLTRASFLGGQRYAATWTGDNRAEWEHLRNTIPMIANLGLSGQPFAGPDIGGFAIGDDESGELFARWMGIGALLPFSRGHAAKDGRNKEPWEFGPAVEASCRTSLQRRYRLLPYFYTLFQEAAERGSPVLRPLFFADAADARLRDVDTVFLLGADLLVMTNPAADGAAIRGVAMPRGVWHDLWLIGEDERRDAHQPQLFVRGGAIVPLGRVVESTTEKMLDPLTLVVSLDESGRAEGTLYEDAGDGFGYQAGEFLLTRYVARRDGNQVTVKISEQRGGMQRPKRKCVVEVLTKGGAAVRAEGDDGAEIQVTMP